jgi:hypothetical protein
MMPMSRMLLPVACLIAAVAAPRLAAQVPDLVLLNGRVIDPASGTDAVRHVGISDGRIVVVSEQPIEGHRAVDVRGLVVAPGFIDLQSHAHHVALQESHCSCHICRPVTWPSFYESIYVSQDCQRTAQTHFQILALHCQLQSALGRPNENRPGRWLECCLDNPR